MFNLHFITYRETPTPPEQHRNRFFASLFLETDIFIIYSVIMHINQNFMGVLNIASYFSPNLQTFLKRKKLENRLRQKVIYTIQKCIVGCLFSFIQVVVIQCYIQSRSNGFVEKFQDDVSRNVFKDLFSCKRLLQFRRRRLQFRTEEHETSSRNLKSR